MYYLLTLYVTNYISLSIENKTIEKTRQNEFRDLGLVKLVARLIKSDMIAGKTLIKAMKLGVVLVDGGNVESQNHLLQYLSSSECGDGDGHFFKHLNDVIQEGIAW